MRQIISIFFVLVFAIGFASPASAFVLGFQVIQDGNTAVVFGFSDNRQENQYYEPRPRNQRYGVQYQAERPRYQQRHRSQADRQYGHGEPMMDCRRNIMPAGNIPGRFRDQDTGTLCR